MPNLETVLSDMFNNLKNNQRIQPIGLGGVTGRGTTFIGFLPQSRVAYDSIEAAMTGIAGSSYCLLDNLNHIRYRIQSLETASGIISVLDNGILISSGITDLNFTDNISVVLSGTTAIISSSGISGSGASNFLDLTDTPDSYAGQAGKYLVVNVSENGLDFVTLSGTVSGTSDHTQLINLNSTNYYHLTQAEYTDLTGGNDTVLHNHNTLYYNKTEVASGFSTVGHTHDDRYYTETEVNTLISGVGGSITVKESDNTPTLSGITTLTFSGATISDNGSGNALITIIGGSGTGTSDHTQLTNLNSTNYYHLTQTQYDDLTDGGETTLHTHPTSSGVGTGSITVYDDGVIVASGITQINVGSGISVSVDGTMATFDVQSSSHIYTEVISGTGTSFSTSNTFIPNSLNLYYNGLRQTKTYYSENITLNGFTTTFTKESSDILSVDYVTASNEVINTSYVKPVREFIFGVNDTLIVESGVMKLYNLTGETITITNVFITVGTAPTGASIIIDINKEGTTIFTTQANRPAIIAGAYTGNSTSMNITSFENNSYLTMDIDQVGSTVAGANIVCHVIGR